MFLLSEGSQNKHTFSVLKKVYGSSLISIGRFRISSHTHMKVITSNHRKTGVNVNLSMDYCKWIQKLAVKHFTLQI